MMTSDESTMRWQEQEITRLNEEIKNLAIGNLEAQHRAAKENFRLRCLLVQDADGNTVTQASFNYLLAELEAVRTAALSLVYEMDKADREQGAGDRTQEENDAYERLKSILLRSLK
jgi:hypothetical protein